MLGNAYMESSLSKVKQKYVRKHSLFDVCRAYNKICNVILSKSSNSYNDTLLESKQSLHCYIYQFVKCGVVLQNTDGTFFVPTEYRNLNYYELANMLRGFDMKQVESERLENINAKKMLNVQVKKKTFLDVNHVKALSDKHKDNTTSIDNDSSVKEAVPYQKVRENMDGSKVPTLFDIHVASRFKTIMVRAKEKGIEFDITIKQLARVMKTTHCAYTGVKFSDNAESENYLTIDRVDHTKGYTKSNIVACTSRANSIKSLLLETSDSTFKSVDEMTLFSNSIAKLMEK